MAFSLSDDGTLDTVLTCDVCGQDERYTFVPDVAYSPDPAPPGPELAYDAFVAWALEDAEQLHECGEEV